MIQSPAVLRQLPALRRSLNVVRGDFVCLTAWTLRNLFVNAVAAVTTFTEELVR